MKKTSKVECFHRDKPDGRWIQYHCKVEGDVKKGDKERIEVIPIEKFNPTPKLRNYLRILLDTPDGIETYYATGKDQIDTVTFIIQKGP